MPCIMPERLALTDPFKQVSGDGRQRPLPLRRGRARLGVQPSCIGVSQGLCAAGGRASPASRRGAKAAHFERIEWHVIPDAGNCDCRDRLAAGEMDWWQSPTPDVLGPPCAAPAASPLENAGSRRAASPSCVSMRCSRHSTTRPVRRAVLGAINQDEFMEAAVGERPVVVEGRGRRIQPGHARSPRTTGIAGARPVSATWPRVKAALQ